jgi:hypothetical protein
MFLFRDPNDKLSTRIGLIYYLVGRKMDLLSSDLIRPLKNAENHFVEVLLTDFKLSKRERGSELQVKFDDNTPTIWTSQARYSIKRSIPDFDNQVTKYQKVISDFLLRPKDKPFKFRDKNFPFRYASGGTLPILRIGNNEYYCLFYREIFPIGWNIANGGCDNRFELLYPIDTIERELREELMIVDVKKRKRYVFSGDENKPFDHPSFAVARKFWRELPKLKDLPSYKETPILLKWLEGPDYLVVQQQKDNPRTIQGCFLNINAEDFGIEVDKVAKIHLDENAILMDGEITGNRLVNSVIGLFEVSRFNREFIGGRNEFYPDYFFYNADSWDVDQLESKIALYMDKIGDLRAENEKIDYASCSNKFALCPVTKKILARYLSLQSEKQHKGNDFDIFISFGGDDAESALKLFEYLRRKNYRVFLSTESIIDPDFSKTIDDALDSARCLIAVGTKPENLMKNWPGYEYRAFHNDILSGRKKDAKLISFISDFDPLDLPLPLRKYQVVMFNKTKIETGLKDLTKFIV